MPIIGVTNHGEGTIHERIEFSNGMSTQISHVFEDSRDLWVEHGVSSQPSMVFVDGDGTTTLNIGALGPQGLLAKAKELAAT